jgi:hypothetical protein
MAVRGLLWRDDWQSNVVDVFRTKVDVVLASQSLLRPDKLSVSCERNLDVADYVDLPVIWPSMLENTRSLSISRSNF